MTDRRYTQPLLTRHDALLTLTGKTGEKAGDKGSEKAPNEKTPGEKDPNEKISEKDPNEKQPEGPVT